MEKRRVEATKIVEEGLVKFNEQERDRLQLLEDEAFQKEQEELIRDEQEFMVITKTESILLYRVYITTLKICLFTGERARG